MKQRYGILIGAFALLAALAGCSNNETKTPAQPTTGGGGAVPVPAGPTLKIGYVLHGLNDFTQVIKKGAEDAGQDLNAKVDVTGPAGFVAQDAIAMFEGMT